MAGWCDEKFAVYSATITAKDLRALTSLKPKHKALEDEMVRRHKRFLSGPFAIGQDMIKSGHPLADQLQDRVRVVQGKWAMLNEEAAKRRLTLDSATDAYLFFSDCIETDSFIKKSITLAKSKVRENPFKIACNCFDILGFWSRYVNSPVFAPETQVSPGQDLVQRGRCVESGGGKGRTENSQNSTEALYLTAEPARAKDMEKLVPTEVIIQAMLSLSIHSIIM